MNELDFSGKQVLVVGGSSGIGNGIAQAFRAKGARVAVCAGCAAAIRSALDRALPAVIYGEALRALDIVPLQPEVEA